MAERITPSEVRHVARLARLELSEEEVEVLTRQLGTILEHAARIQALDTDHLPPSAHPLPLRNVLRPDEPRPGLDRETVLAAAPASESRRFRVPRILEGG